MNDGTTRKRA
jgi:hypothetical protein